MSPKAPESNDRFAKETAAFRDAGEKLETAQFNYMEAVEAHIAELQSQIDELVGEKERLEERIDSVRDDLWGAEKDLEEAHKESAKAAKAARVAQEHSAAFASFLRELDDRGVADISDLRLKLRVARQFVYPVGARRVYWSKP